MKRYDKKNFPRTINDFAKMHREGKLSFENAVQRGLTWDQERKSLLIHSIIIDFPVPPMYCNCIFENPKNKLYDFIDGKQRVLGALIPFFNDDFALTGVPLVNLDEDSENDDDADEEKVLDLNGLKYSELPDEIKDIIRSYNFVVYYYENMAQEDVEEMFYRLNNGKPLSSIELSRAKAKSLETIKEVANHSIFHVALKENAFAKYVNEDLTIKSWALLHEETPSFETKAIRPLIQSVEINEEQKKELKNIYSLILDVHNELKTDDDKNFIKVAKRILTKTHLLSLVPLTRHVIKKGIAVEDFAKWVFIFFSGKKSASISDAYNSTIGSGSAKPEAIRKRIAAITEHFEDHFVNYVQKVDYSTMLEQDKDEINETVQVKEM